MQKNVYLTFPDVPCLNVGVCKLCD